MVRSDHARGLRGAGGRDGQMADRRIRFVAIDVDGTLIQRGQPIDPRVREAIASAQRAGAIVTLASGRMYPLVATLLEDLQLIHPVICYGGAMVVRASSGETIFERGVPLDLARDVIREARQRDLTARAYVGNAVFVDRLDPDRFNAESLRR